MKTLNSTVTTLTKERIRWIELEAATIRRGFGFNSEEAIDPLKNQQRLKIQVVFATQDMSPSNPLIEKVLAKDAKTWSAIAQQLPSGDLFILANPHQPIERARVSIFEEISHRHFGHKPSLIEQSFGRIYQKESEADAFWTAAAIMLPSKQLSRMVFRGATIINIAREFGTSIELVEFRVKILRLWKLSKGYKRAQEVMKNAIP
jgi:Zn-dependent peptidase ImmA (M78 family)